MDSNAVFAILLLIVGIGILTAEVFIPTGGLLGIVTFTTLAFSVLFAWRAWGTSHANVFWVFCTVLLVLVPSAIGTAFYFLPRTPFGKRILLEAPAAERLTPFANQAKSLRNYIGMTGKTVSPLNPGGTVMIGDERLDAVSEGLVIESGQTVEIMEVRGRNLVVRVASVTATTSNPQRTESPPRLDFDFPTS